MTNLVALTIVLASSVTGFAPAAHGSRKQSVALKYMERPKSVSSQTNLIDVFSFESEAAAQEKKEKHLQDDWVAREFNNNAEDSVFPTYKMPNGRLDWFSLASQAALENPNALMSPKQVIGNPKDMPSAENEAEISNWLVNKFRPTRLSTGMKTVRANHPVDWFAFQSSQKMKDTGKDDNTRIIHAVGQDIPQWFVERFGQRDSQTLREVKLSDSVDWFSLANLQATTLQEEALPTTPMQRPSRQDLAQWMARKFRDIQARTAHLDNHIDWFSTLLAKDPPQQTSEKEAKLDHEEWFDFASSNMEFLR